MNFDSGTAYAESDADDEYERDIHDSSPIDATDAEGSPTESDTPSNEHTPTTYGYRSAGDRLPETLISKWNVEECADFLATIGLQQYADRFIGWFFYLFFFFFAAPTQVVGTPQGNRTKGPLTRGI